MEKQETINFMQRVKSHYQEFIIDDFKIQEWHNQLKDYDAEDINAKLDKHLKSETFGDYPPKLNYLTAGILTTKDKNTVTAYYIICPNCERIVSLAEYEEHMRLCNAIEYFIKNFKKYCNKETTREKLESLDEKTFWDKYDSLLTIIEDKLPEGSMSKKFIQAYFGKIDLSKEEIEQTIKENMEV